MLWFHFLCLGLWSSERWSCRWCEAGVQVHFFHVDIWLCSPICSKVLTFFSLNCLGTFCENQWPLYLWVFFWILCPVSRFLCLSFYSIKLYSLLMLYAAAAAKSLQPCPTLCDPIDSSQPGSPVPGILQARTLEWVAISFSNSWKRKVKVKSLSRVQLLATPWTAAYQAPPSMGFSRQEYWSGVPSPSPDAL